MERSHTIESTMPVWSLIEENPAVRVLFIEGVPFCPWCSDKAQIRIADRHAAAAAHVIPTLAFGQPVAVIEGLQVVAWACDEIAKSLAARKLKK